MTESMELSGSVLFYEKNACGRRPSNSVLFYEKNACGRRIWVHSLVDIELYIYMGEVPWRDRKTMTFRFRPTLRFAASQVWL